MDVLKQSNNILQFELTPFQDEFVFSQAKFPAMVSGIGTGKSLCLILKVLNICQDYSDSLVLIIRKEYTDLRDSTIKDFQRYTGMIVDSNKEVHFPNKSVILFRHGDIADLNILRNLNLTAFGIEQIDEYKSEDAFIFLRDRLRRNNISLHQGFVVGNTNGHNFVWRMWKNNPFSKEYHLVEANTFQNAHNLPTDFIEDQKRMEHESPHHYNRFVMNSWEETEGDDFLLTWPILNYSIQLEMKDTSYKRILGTDVARFGDNETVFTIIENRGIKQWEQTYIEGHLNKDTVWTTGRFLELWREFNCDIGVVDDDNIGGGVVDQLKALSIEVKRFQGGTEAKKKEFYGNKRSEGFCEFEDLIKKGYLKILNDSKMVDQLLTIRYKFMSKGQKLIVSKDEMKKKGIKSPDRADALMMAVSGIGRTERAFREEIPNAPKLY